MKDTIYRHIKIEQWGTHYIKFTNTFKVDSFEYREGFTYPNGFRYVSIPTAYKNNPLIYAKRCIDRCYEQMLYFKSLETKKLHGDYKSRTGYTIEMMKQKA